jgi:chromosome segregation ATPase
VYFASADERIRGGRSEEASAILQNMRQFLNTPAFQGIRSIQTRKDFYTRSIDVLEELVAASGESPPAPTVPDQDTEQAVAALTAENARLQETIAGLNRTIATNSRGSNTNQQRLSELETTVTTLRISNSTLEATATERQKAIADLQSQNAALTQTVTARDSEIKDLNDKNAAQEQRITNLGNQLTNLREAIRTLNQQNGE